MLEIIVVAAEIVIASVADRRESLIGATVVSVTRETASEALPDQNLAAASHHRRPASTVDDRHRLLASAGRPAAPCEARAADSESPAAASLIRFLITISDLNPKVWTRGSGSRSLNARVVPTNGTAQRAARQATKSASQASSEAESQNVVPPVNGNPAGGPDAVNAAILEELQRWADGLNPSNRPQPEKDVCYNSRRFKDVPGWKLDGQSPPGVNSLLVVKEQTDQRKRRKLQRENSEKEEKK
ncbi:hypothetical protein Bca4012_065500 [Brassica carinata]